MVVANPWWFAFATRTRTLIGRGQGGIATQLGCGAGREIQMTEWRLGIGLNDSARNLGRITRRGGQTAARVEITAASRQSRIAGGYAAAQRIAAEGHRTGGGYAAGQRGVRLHKAMRCREEGRVEGRRAAGRDHVLLPVGARRCLIRLFVCKQRNEINEVKTS